MEDKYKLSSTNIVLIVVLSCIVILDAIVVIMLAVSYNDDDFDLPELVVTENRTSTKYKTKKTTETTTSTTTKQIIMDSPYYSIDLSLLDRDIYTKRDLSNDEVKTLVEEVISLQNKIMDISDNTLLNIDNVIKYAKDGEKDKLVVDDNEYGIIYNSNEYFSKIYTNLFLRRIGDKKYKSKNVFYLDGDTYYRIKNNFGNNSITIVEKKVNKITSEEINASYIYYKNNYRDDGYTSPVYNETSIRIIYDNGRWKVHEYTYPLYD